MKGELSTETRFPERTAGDAGTLGDVPALTVLAHPDLNRVGEIVVLPELISGRSVELSRREPSFAHPGETESRPLGDPYLSRKPLRLRPGGAVGEILLERAGSPTAAQLDGEPLGESRLVDAGELPNGLVLELGASVALLLHLHPAVTPRVPRFGLVGDSLPMLRLRRDVEIAAGLDTSVLLRGASGTGKELVARALHDTGGRRDRPWITVNMAAIPPALAASELFGAKKGAYTGADRDKQGFFAAADGGTLFLDEVGDTPSDVQPLLLRALESGEIQPVGSAETRRVDVRVIAATDADLDDAIAAGRFRAPLLHRLAGWEIHLPALAARRADVGRLLVHFVSRELGDDATPSWASAPLVAALARYDWPGNVRQLANVARRLAIYHRADPEAPLLPFVESLLKDARPSALATAEPAAPANTPPPGRWRPVYRKASDVGEEELVDALRAHQWDLKPTAEHLGVSRSVLYQLIDACPRTRTAAQLATEEIEGAVEQAGGDVVAAAAALEVSAQGLKMRMKALGLR